MWLRKLSARRSETLVVNRLSGSTCTAAATEAAGPPISRRLGRPDCARPWIALAAVVAAALLQAGVANAAPHAATVPLYGVFEQTLHWSSSASNPWEQVSVDVRLVQPHGGAIRVGGFYASPGTWKFRYAPSELGRWSWSARVVDGARSGSFQGSFVVVPGSSPGFVRESPLNPQRWTFSNGSPFYPIGIQDCTGDDGPDFRFGLDGGFRSGPNDPGRTVDMATYMRAYSSAGFDLFRWGPDNCSFSLYQTIDPAGNVYSSARGADADLLFQTLRRYGFRIEMVLFGFHPPFTGAADAADPAKMAAVDRYVRYVVDRYGAYVDFWELMNEATASDTWINQIGGYLHKVDPYRHPVGTNWSVPQLSVIDFGTDHWYSTDDPHQSDVAAWQRLRSEPARALGKPTLVDEQGNSGQNWDPNSALRLRLRSWTAFFAEAVFVFWNTSWAKDYQANSANVYLGPQERGYVRILQNYTRRFDPRAKVVPAHLAPSAAARGYALRGPRNYGLYVVSAGDFTAPTSGVTATVDPAHAGTATWTDPATGRVLATKHVRSGAQTLSVPTFVTDIALKITSASS
jgi:hypothetical protein